MRLKGISEEDFVQYKEPSMFLISCFCDWKCCLELDIPTSVCQNEPVAQNPIHNIDNSVIFEHYISNPITKAVVIGGLEPMLQIGEICELIELFRKNGCNDDFVIYTGYYPEEITAETEQLKKFKNVVIKFGRYIPNSQNKYDEVLNVTLASNNQFALRIS